jgi:hypothetical protein
MTYNHVQIELAAKRQQARHDQCFRRTSHDDGQWHAPEISRPYGYSAIKVGGWPLHLQAAPPHAVDRRDQPDRLADAVDRPAARRPSG